METNPTSPNHVRALIGVQFDLLDIQHRLAGKLCNATDPDAYLAAFDLAEIRSKLSDVLGRVKAFENDLRKAESATPVRVVRITVSDLDPKAIEELLSTACKCEPMAERARRIVG